MNARERSRLDTRKRLMQKGMELFAKQGVVDTRASDIAKECELAVGTLYLHFKDKQGLLRAILYEELGELMDALARFAASPPSDPIAAVRAHTRILVQFAEEHPLSCRILFDPESVRNNISIEITARLVTMQEQRIREGIASGFVSASLDPMIASHAMVGMLLQVLNWWTRHPEAASAETVIETLTRLRLSGIVQKLESQ
jgi:AcrR family transcriptional regulator